MPPAHRILGRRDCTHSLLFPFYFSLGQSESYIPPGALFMQTKGWWSTARTVLAPPSSPLQIAVFPLNSSSGLFFITTQSVIHLCSKMVLLSWPLCLQVPLTDAACPWSCVGQTTALPLSYGKDIQIWGRHHPLFSSVQ